MKELVRKFNSFISFSTLLDPEYIKARFDSTHNKSRSPLSHWSTRATRQELISSYWFTNVLGHFIAIFGLALLLVNLIEGRLVFIRPGALLLTGLITFPGMFLFLYLPLYQSIFLPRLETAMELYEKAWEKRQEECRKTQWQGLSLILVMYGLFKANGINALQPTSETAEMLNRLLGRDPGGLKKHLELLLGPSGARKKLNPRNQTEMQNRFSEVYQLFEDWQFTAGIQSVKELENRIFNS